MKYLRHFAALAFALSLAGCASTPEDGKLEPGQVFEGPRLRIQAPPGAGWQLVGNAPGALVFGRSGPQAAESAIVSVSDFPLPPEAAGAAFEAFVRQQIAQDIDPSRFELKGQAIELDKTAQANPPNQPPAEACVRVHSLALDKRALGSADPLLLEIIALYCRYPGDASTGYVASYSYRGAQRDAALPGLAARFLQGVQLRRR